MVVSWCILYIYIYMYSGGTAMDAGNNIGEVKVRVVIIYI